MENDVVSQRAEELDNIISSDIVKRLTLEEANSITSIYGSFLESTGFLTMIFMNDIPESLLPYPKHILVSALERSRQYFTNIGDRKRATFIYSAILGLVGYNSNDDEAFKKAAEMFSDSRWRKAFVKSLKEMQKSNATKGFTLDGKMWKLSPERIAQLMAL